MVTGSGRRLLTATVVLAAILAGIAAALLWAPPSIRGWLAGVLAVVFAGWLAQALPRWFGQVGQGWRQRDGRAPSIAVTVKLLDSDYMVLSDADGTVDVPASGHGVRLIIENTGGRPVLLTALRPEIVERHDAAGDLSRHAGVVAVRHFEVLLDAHPPAVVPVPPVDGGAGVDFPFRVGADDPEVLNLEVHTEHGDVRWVLHMDWVCDGASGTHRIDMGGLAVPDRSPARGSVHALTEFTSHGWSDDV